MTGLTPSQWVSLMENAKVAQVVDDTSGSNLFSSDTAESRMQIPITVVISETNGSANTADIKKVEEDDTTTDLYTNFNLGSNETRVLDMKEVAPIIPRLEGGTNLQVTAGSDGVELTMVYVNNIDFR